MKLARFLDDDASPACGIVTDDEIVVLRNAGDLLPLLQARDDTLADAARDAELHGRRLPLEGRQWLSPIATPPTFRDFYAFESHVKAGRASRGLEMDADWYELPVFYFSNPYALRGSGDVPMTPGSTKFDFELEVAAVLGGGGSDLTPSEGEALIAGFCVLNDWSGRDVQQREMLLSMGPVKGKDTATSLGPWLVTPDELADHRTQTGYDLMMRAEVNGRQYSQALWSDVYWSFGEMIAYASRGTQVRAGDVIGSGTCGTGCILELARTHGAQEYPWLQAGDEVVASVDGLGSLVNRVVAAKPVTPLRPGL